MLFKFISLPNKAAVNNGIEIKEINSRKKFNKFKKIKKKTNLFIFFTYNIDSFTN